jgi:nitroreductase
VKKGMKTMELYSAIYKRKFVILEQIVLKLTTMGIATCWLGGHIKDEDLQGIIDLPEGQSSVVMVSLGYPQNVEDWLRKDPSKAKRKSVSDFVTGSVDETWAKIMEAVRMAPSAANTQPWRFEFDGSKVHVYCEKPGNFLLKKLLGNINRVDVGIALSHVKIASRQIGLNIEFEKVDVSGAQKNYEYIISLQAENDN